MNHLKRGILSCTLGIVLIPLLLTTKMVVAAPLTCGAWSVVPSPNSGMMDNYLNGVVSISLSNVWAVGYSQPNLGGPSQTLIEHWNGTSWSIVSSPSPGLDNNHL